MATSNDDYLSNRAGMVTGHTSAWLVIELPVGRNLTTIQGVGLRISMVLKACWAPSSTHLPEHIRSLIGLMGPKTCIKCTCQGTQAIHWDASVRSDVRRVHPNNKGRCHNMTEPCKMCEAPWAQINFNLRFVVEGAFQKIFQNRNGGITPAPIFAQLDACP